MDADQVTIIVPAYNEAGAIDAVVSGLLARVPEAELIVVDDGSDDQTAKLAAESGARVVSHEQRHGYGASLMTGIEAASRDHVLFCDGDGQHTAEDVERLIGEADGYDMVVGARGRDSHQLRSRRPGKWVLTVFAAYLAGQHVPDLNSGLRLFRKDVLKRYLHLMPEGFSFSTTSTFAMLKTRRRIKYVPITTIPRIGSSTVRPLRHGAQTLLLILRLAVLFEPLKVFLHVTGLLLMLSLLSFGNDCLFYDAGISDSTVILSISTILVFMLGLLCDQVAALRREMHR